MVHALMRLKGVHLLVVEDNPADIRLPKEAFSESKLRPEIHVAMDGQAALDFLNGGDNPKPHLILLDLNLPRKTGHEVLETVKRDAVLRKIPILVLSSSAAATDIGRAYDLHANCFIQKPSDLDEFLNLMLVIENFWMRIVRLPPAEKERF